MHKFGKLIVIMMACAFLAACAAQKNEYGVPVNQWQRISKQDQSLITQSNQPMTFNEG